VTFMQRRVREDELVVRLVPAGIELDRPLVAACRGADQVPAVAFLQVAVLLVERGVLGVPGEQLLVYGRRFGVGGLAARPKAQRLVVVHQPGRLLPWRLALAGHRQATSRWRNWLALSCRSRCSRLAGGGGRSSSASRPAAIWAATVRRIADHRSPANADSSSPIPDQPPPPSPAARTRPSAPRSRQPPVPAGNPSSAATSACVNPARSCSTTICRSTSPSWSSALTTSKRIPSGSPPVAAAPWPAIPHAVSR